MSAVLDEPTREEWKRLFDAALAFRDAAPWLWMSEDRNFGIRPLDVDTTYYASIMGAIGQHFALALYEGVDGLAGLWQMRYEMPEDPFTVLGFQRCLMMSFEDRILLDERDRGILKDLGIKVRGANAWPQARSYMPRYVPWKIDAAQAHILAGGLEQALLVAQRCLKEPSLIPRATDPEEPLLVRVQSADGKWQDISETPDFKSGGTAEPAAHEDSELLGYLRDTLPESALVLEMDSTMLPAPVQLAPGARPYFPTLVLSGDEARGTVLANDLCKPGELAQGLADQLVGLVASLKYRPAQLLVSSRQAYNILEPTAVALGIDLEHVQNLPALDAAFAALISAIATGELLGDPRATTSGPGQVSSSADTPQPRAGRSVRRVSKRDTPPDSVYQLKVTLRGARPPIWRRILVASNTRLDKLHSILQAAMGWSDSHLHAFEAGGLSYGVPNRDLDILDMENERRFNLNHLLVFIGSRMNYEYDFGDSWIHEIRLEKVLPFDPNVKLPSCVTGKRACPPEDCGGIWGYANLLEALNDPSHPEHSIMVEWIGQGLDPNEFSADEVNRRLSRLR